MVLVGVPRGFEACKIVGSDAFGKILGTHFEALLALSPALMGLDT